MCPTHGFKEAWTVLHGSECSRRGDNKCQDPRAGPSTSRETGVTGEVSEEMGQEGARSRVTLGLLGCSGDFV